MTDRPPGPITHAGKPVPGWDCPPKRRWSITWGAEVVRRVKTWFIGITFKF